MDSSLHRLTRAVMFLSIGFVATTVMALYSTIRIDRFLRDQATATAKARMESVARQEAILGIARLLRDCVGLTEGGECQMRLVKQQAKALATFKTDLIGALTPALTKALEEKFGILQGRLIIRLEQGPDGTQTVVVGSQNPGQKPGGTTALPPGKASPSPTARGGTVVQECVVELHAEPLVGACVVPRP